MAARAVSSRYVPGKSRPARNLVQLLASDFIAFRRQKECRIGLSLRQTDNLPCPSTHSGIVMDLTQHLGKSLHCPNLIRRHERLVISHFTDWRQTSCALPLRLISQDE